jgi:hypothetical protein
MSPMPVSRLFVAAALGAGLFASQAQATGLRTFVSGAGSDTGACALASPCRTLAFAFTQTAATGEIVVLDPAGYGPVTITQAVSILNDGVGVAAITAPTGGNGITVQAGASDAVYLRGLTVKGSSTANVGIDFVSGGSLQIVDCDIHDFSNPGVAAGIQIEPSTSSSFSIANTNASDNVNIGIYVLPHGSAVVHGVVSRSTTNNNNFGIVVDDIALNSGTPLNVDIVDSVSSGNNEIGVYFLNRYRSRGHEFQHFGKFRWIGRRRRDR